MNSSKKFWCESKGLSLLLGFTLLFLVVACGPQTEEGYFKGDAMGTFYTIEFRSEEKVPARNLRREIEDLLDAFEQQLSNWRKDSWVNLFNAAPADEFIPVPDYAFQVLNLCQELFERSGGLLDPTVSPLIELWGFGIKPGSTVPEQAAIDEALKKIGFDKLVLSPDRPAVMKRQADLQINCSALAKGYAVDLISGLLQNRGLDNFVINLGGEIAARGSRMDGDPWTVGVNRPDAKGREKDLARVFELTNRSLATSGHSQRTFVSGGRRYSHILNAKTGRPVTADIAAATVLASSCALADGLATLALILDEDRMTELLEFYDGVEVFRTEWAAENLALNNEYQKPFTHQNP